ncbi:MAG: hypothetical protein RR400_03185 [Clostridia bacterium]
MMDCTGFFFTTNPAIATLSKLGEKKCAWSFNHEFVHAITTKLIRLKGENGFLNYSIMTGFSEGYGKFSREQNCKRIPVGSPIQTMDDLEIMFNEPQLQGEKVLSCNKALNEGAVELLNLLSAKNLRKQPVLINSYFEYVKFASQLTRIYGKKFWEALFCNSYLSIASDENERRLLTEISALLENEFVVTDLIGDSGELFVGTETEVQKYLIQLFEIKIKKDITKTSKEFLNFREMKKAISLSYLEFADDILSSDMCVYGEAVWQAFEMSLKSCLEFGSVQRGFKTNCNSLANKISIIAAENNSQRQYLLFGDGKEIDLRDKAKIERPELLKERLIYSKKSFGNYLVE